MANAFLFANNDTSTLAGAVSNVALTATLAPGSGALFPNPGANQQFALTFISASNPLLFEVVFVTARSGDVVTIVRAQEGTSAQAWAAGDLAVGLVTAAGLASFAQVGVSARIRLTADTSFYVSATGVDAPGRGTISLPWATMQYAVNYVQLNYDLAGFILTFIRVNSTGYTDSTAVTGLFVGQTQPIVFDASAATNVTVTTAGSVCYLSDLGAEITVQNQKLVCSGNNILYATRGGIINYGGVNFGATPGAHLAVDRDGQVRSIAAYTISGAAAYHIVVSSIGIADLGVAVTITGTPAITTFASATQAGVLNGTSASFTGGTTGTRYSATLNGVINTSGGGASFFPGSIAGATATGGQYA